MANMNNDWAITRPVDSDILCKDSSKGYARQLLKYGQAKANQRLLLTNFAPEILLKPSRYLRPAESACMGITSQKLYAIRRNINGSVSLEEPTSHAYLLLDHALANWAAGGGLVFDNFISRHFVTAERLKKLELKRDEDEREREDHFLRRYRHERKHGRYL